MNHTNRFNDNLPDSTFRIPTLCCACNNCLCKLLSSTSSLSINPIVPTPALTKYIDDGQPKPPTPTISTLEVFNFLCPKNNNSLI